MELKIINDIVKIVKSNNNDYWDKDSKKRLKAFEKLNEDLSNYFNLPKSKIIVNNIFGFGCYDGKNIVMNKFSLITFLHEFFHKLTHNEFDVRILSILIYALAYPNKFEKCKLENGIVRIINK